MESVYETCKATMLNAAMKNFVEQLPYSHELCPPNLDQEILAPMYWSVSSRPVTCVVNFDYCALINTINTRAFKDCFRKFAHQLSDYILMDRLNFKTHGVHKNLHKLFLYTEHHALSDPDRSDLSRLYLNKKAVYIHSLMDQIKDICLGPSGLYVQTIGYSNMARLYVELRLFGDELQTPTTLGPTITIQTDSSELRHFLLVESFFFHVQRRTDFGSAEETEGHLERANHHLCSLLNYMRVSLNKSIIEESATYCIIGGLLRNHGYTEFSFYTPGMDRHSFEDYAMMNLQDVMLNFLSVVRHGIFGCNLENVSRWLMLEVCDAVCMYLSSAVYSQRVCKFENLRIASNKKELTAASTIEEMEIRTKQLRCVQSI